MCQLKGCGNGLYGDDCKKTCGNCREINQCSHKNGTCLTGCDDGYLEKLCKTRK